VFIIIVLKVASVTFIHVYKECLKNFFVYLKQGSSIIEKYFFIIEKYFLWFNELWK